MLILALSASDSARPVSATLAGEISVPMPNTGISEGATAILLRYVACMFCQRRLSNTSVTHLTVIITIPR